MASKQGAEFEESLGRGLIGMFRKPLRLIPFGIACLICYEVTKNLDSAANSLGLTGVNRFFLLFVFLILVRLSAFRCLLVLYCFLF